MRVSLQYSNGLSKYLFRLPQMHSFTAIISTLSRDCILITRSATLGLLNDVKLTTIKRQAGFRTIARLPVSPYQRGPIFFYIQMASHPASNTGVASEIFTGPAANVMREQQEAQHAKDGKREHALKT